MIKVKLTRIDRATLTVSSIEEIKPAIALGWRVASVNGKDILGTCEICGLPILHNDVHVEDSEGVMWHKRCDTWHAPTEIAREALGDD